MDRAFRFGVNLFGTGTREDFLTRCARAEELGYDVVQVPDHLGAAAPFPALVAASGVTERVRLGTFVLNAGFYTPDVLARDVAGTDALVGGRLELGLGTGYNKEEFERAGLAYGTPGARFDHLAATVARVRALLADPQYAPAPVQRPVPLLLGGHGPRMLRYAARHADVVGFTGARADGVGNLSLATPDEIADRVGGVLAAAGERAGEIELNVLVQVVAPEAGELRAYAPDLCDETFDALPTVLVGRPEAIAEKVLAMRKRFGFTYLTVLENSLEYFGEVIPLLRGA